MPLALKRLPIEGLFMIEPERFRDERGFFVETYKESEFAKQGLARHFPQDNQSSSFRGVLRGLHFQMNPYAQAKLVRVVRGAVWDVAVDIRRNSPSYGRWHGQEISEENGNMLFIPEGFAHGFVTLRDDTLLLYKCSAEYHSASEGGIRWDDPELDIKWPIRDVIVSDKDKLLPYLKDFMGAGA